MKTYEEKANNALKRIEEENENRRKKKTAVSRILTPVMSLCLVVMLGIGVWQSGLLGRSDNKPTAPAKGEYKVYTDSVKLPEKTSGDTADMIGCLLYKGKVYTQSTDSDINDSAIAEQLVGEYVGEAKGTLNEWSSQEDWATEFASTYSGSVYKVKGYSEDFRLCVYVNNDGEKWLQLLDNYDRIGLNTGSDLFEKRLHITGNVESVAYRTHSDWNKGNMSDCKNLTGVAKESFEDFLTELCSSPFVKINYEDNPNFYDTETQGHLYLNMKDGTQVELRLIEGGYVGCQGCGWLFVKMPVELFNDVLAAVS